jgi:hypothetical protein
MNIHDGRWSWEHEIAQVGSEYDLLEGVRLTTLWEAIESYEMCCCDKAGSKYLIIHVDDKLKITHRFTLKEIERLLKIEKL